jgi:hypothetical protein
LIAGHNARRILRQRADDSGDLTNQRGRPVGKRLIVTRIKQIERRRDQRVHIDLRTRAEQDAVAVDHEHSALCGDIAEDLTGCA